MPSPRLPSRAHLLIALAVLLGCKPTGGDGDARDSSGAPSKMVQEISVDLDPPGARRGDRYVGRVVARDSKSPLGPAGMVVEAIPVDGEAIRDVRTETKDGEELILEELILEFRVSASAKSTERIDLRLRSGDGERHGVLYLRVVESSWDPSWRPVAVAPEDTTVDGPDAEIVLDARRSHHPAGADAVHFKWSIDGGATVIKDGTLTSTKLSRGTHTVVLVAEDSFGNVSTDTMRVVVR